jgi:hypothetical protein
MPSNQIGGEFWQAVRLTFSRAILDPNILAFQIAGFPKTLSEVPQLRRCPRQPDMQNSNHRHRRLLRTRSERPGSRPACDEREELAPTHGLPSSG